MYKTVYDFSDINAENEFYKLQITQKRKLSDVGHSHKFYEFVLVLEGQILQEINGENCKLNVGDYVLLLPKDEHRIISQSKDANVLCLSVAEEEFYEAALFLNNGKICDFCSFENRKIYKVGDDLSAIASAALRRGQDCGELFCKRLLVLFLVCCLETEMHRDENFPASLAFAENEMKKEENLRNGNMAFIKLSGYSYSQLSRHIKQKYGVSVHEFVKRMRLEEAYKRIIFTNEAYEDISESVGYFSFSHFSKIFKNKYGISPAELRKKHGFATI